MQLFADWSYPTLIRFGAGRIKELAEACETLDMARPLLVTDPGLANLPMTTNAVELCREAGLGIGVFSDIKPNPNHANVMSGVAAYKAGDHDGIIAFGGGSALDCAKVIAFMHDLPGPVWDYADESGWWSDIDPSRFAPIIAVPTTAGTGSEVGRAAVIVREETHEKIITYHPRMMPSIVISDPELTVGLPPVLTAGVGLDAFAHSLEAYCAPTFHPQSDGIALEGMRLVKEALSDAVRDGNDIDARAKMLAAASMGAVAFQKGLGAIHSLSHPIGAIYDTHHGMTNAVIMPYVLDFNRASINHKMDRLAAYLGLQGGFEGVKKWVLEIREEISVPHTLEAFGIDDAQVGRVCDMAATDPTAQTNPVELTPDAAEQIFAAAWQGKT